MSLKSQFLLWAAGLLLIGLNGCQTEEITPAVEIDAQLAPFFERFESEALQRGLEAPVTGQVSGRLTTIEESGVAGRCEHYTNRPNAVLVDQSYWQKASELQKEYLVFHELGHCFLQRSHLDDRDAYGRCVSIMQSGQDACRMSYTYVTREGYLDELFTER
jgi:hypothetical protein